MAGALASGVAGGTLHAVCVGAAAGALWGAPWALGFRLFGGRRGWIAWPLLSLGAGAWLAWRLEAFSKLGGPHAGLAWAVLAACLAGAVALSLATLALQPRPEQARGWLGGRARWVAVAVAVLAGAGCAWADRALFSGLYEDAHLALRWAAGWLWTAALYLGWTWRGFGWGALLVVFPLFTLGPDDAGALLDGTLSAAALGTVRAATDVDLDGYSAWFAGGDCAPFDSAVHPGATEIPGNGVDDNCRLGDATVHDRGEGNPPVPLMASPLSVALITIDTVRPDHLSAYGYRRATSPRIAAFAEQAQRFDRAYTSGGWTSLAVPSLMRGVYPRRLRWTRLYETNRYRLLRASQTRRLRKKERVRYAYTMPVDTPRKPLAFWLRRRGMFTAAVVDDGYSQFLDAKLGLAAGFDSFESVDRLKKRNRTDAGTARLARRAIARLPTDRPFFLWVHFFGPHDPSTRHAGFEHFGPSPIDAYDHELRFTDHHVGRVLDALDATGRPVATVITSDHGELFKRRKRQHGNDLSEANLRIPLIIRAPGWPTGPTDRLSSLVDVMPTLLALTETPQPYRMDGVDLAQPAAHRAVLAETWRYRKSGPPKRDLVAAFDGTRKLVYDQLTHRSRTVSQPDETPAPPSAELDDAVSRYLEETGGLLTLLD